MKAICLLLMCIMITGVLHAQNVGIGVSAPLGTLDVARGTALSGTAMFRGSTHASHFNYGSTEDTYIRGGKAGSHVIINEASNLGNVGIGLGTPATKLHISGNSSELLRLQGVSPYLSLYNNSSPTGYLQAFGNDLFMGTHFGNTTGALRFFNNNVNHMTILADGNIGIGITNPQSRLHVHNSAEALRISGFNSFLSLYDNSGNGVGYFQNNSGNIDIGTFVGNTNGEVRVRANGELGLVVQSDTRVRVGTLPTVQLLFDELPKFSVHGPLGLRATFGDQVAEWAIYAYTNLNFFYNGGQKAYVDGADGEWIELSDYILKQSFQEYPSVLERIKKLHVLTYHYKADKTNTRSLGLIAQHVREHFPEIVSQSSGPEGYLGIAYAKTGVLAIKAIQEQQILIEEQQKHIEQLEQRLNALEQRLK